MENFFPTQAGTCSRRRRQPNDLEQRRSEQNHEEPEQADDCSGGQRKREPSEPRPQPRDGEDRGGNEPEEERKWDCPEQVLVRGLRGQHANA